MAQATDQAEYYRQHREAFALALEQGITPKKAAELLARRRWEETDQRLAAKRNPTPALRQEHEFPRGDEPWMMRD